MLLPAPTTITPRLRSVALAALLVLSPAAEGETAPAFREVSGAWQLDFLHHHGGSGRFYMVETMGSGVVLFDYDRDGDTDVLFVDSGALPGYDGPATGSRLFRNESGGRFADVSARAGLADSGYGMGATAGDVDRDGDLDLYLTAFGVNKILRNRGDGSFEPAPELGAADPEWSTSAAFADVDRDGDLDLYVANYVDFRLDNNLPCGDMTRGLRSYCHPDSYDGVEDSFWVNDGSGRLSASEGAAATGEPGKGLGVVFVDDDVDGLPDLYVANDMTANLLFRNRGGARFEEEGLASGVAYSDRGEPEAGMGVAAGDLDGDGRVEIFVTHLDRQSNAVYGRQAGGYYQDERQSKGMVEASFYKVGFGTEFADLDSDGDLDVVVANGHIIHNIEAWGTGTTYRQANQVFVNDGTGKLVETRSTGVDAVRASRGLATGDLDGDGDLDLVISNSNDRAEVYENVTVAGGRWLQVALEGARSDRFGVGARVEIIGNGRRQSREMRTGSSYLSQSPLVLHFGLAGSERVEEALVSWPSGKRQALLDLPADRRLVFVE